MEAAQLIEIELGSAQLFLRAVSEGMITPTLEAAGFKSVPPSYW